MVPIPVPYVQMMMGLTGSGGNSSEFSFSNPSIHKIWRSGVLNSGVITVPSGYSNISWQIIEHQTAAVLASGSGNSVSQTFTYGTGCNVYDLLVSTTKGGYPTLEKVFPGEFTCLPPVFTEGTADRVYTLPGSIGFINDGWVDRGTSAVYKIWVKGDYTGAAGFNFQYFRSDSDNRPIHMIFDNVTITSSSFNFQLTACQNLIIDGCASELVQYGLKCVKSIGGADQNFFVYPSDATHGGKNITMCGIYTNNLEHTSGGSAGFQLSSSNNVTFNYDTFTWARPIAFNCEVNWPAAEGYYMAHFTDAPDGTGRAFSGYSNSLFFRLYANHTANEGFQYGSNFSGDVWGCRWVDTGLNVSQSGQRNILQWSAGNRDCAFYQNYGEGANDGWSAFTGRRGKDMEFFSNVMNCTGPAAVDGVSTFIKMYQNDTYASMNWNVRHNTFLFGDVQPNSIPWLLYNDTGSPTTIFNKLAIVDNIVVADTATEYATANGFDITNLLFSDYNTLDGNDLHFFNLGAKNFRLASTDSPAFRANTTITTVHRLNNYDFEGIKYLAAHEVSGAYSGYELFIGLSTTRNITSSSSLSDIDVPNGTSWATAVASYLPTKVVVNNSDGSTRALTVTWSQGTYDGNTQGTYAVSATFTLPGDITNTNSVTASVNLVVAAPLAPVSLKINFFTGASAGWEVTGATTPSAGAGTTIDYGQLGSTGIGIRALNVTNGTWTGTGSSGGNSASGFPAAVRGTYWYTQATNGASFEIYEITPGALAGRLYTLVILGSRANITGPRTTKFTEVNGAQNGSVDIAPAGAGGCLTFVTLTHCTVVGGVIKITVQGIAPNDASPAAGHINGMTLTSE